jgi:hypothetical protein
MKQILITRPSYDDATTYLFYYAGLIIKDAEEKMFSVLDLKRPRLTKDNFTKIIEKNSPSIIFFNAHGSENTIYGDKIGDEEEILIEEDINHEILNSRLVYARSCWTAASLGNKACLNGGCFIGYNIPFSFWCDERWSAKPLNDNLARLFLEPSNLIISSLLKGNTVEEAVIKSNDLSKKNILKLLRDKEEPGAIASIKLLWSNMQGLQVLGNNQLKA